MIENLGQETLTNITRKLGERGFKCVDEDRVEYERHYYDTQDFRFSKANSMFRTTRHDDGECEGEFKTMVRTKTNMGIRHTKKYKIEDTSLESFAKLSSLDSVKEIEEVPKFRTNLIRKTFVYQRGMETVVFSHDYETIIDAKRGNPMRVIELFGIRGTDDVNEKKYSTTKIGRDYLHDILDEIEGITSTKDMICRIVYNDLINLAEKEQEPVEIGIINDEKDDGSR